MEIDLQKFRSIYSKLFEEGYIFKDGKMIRKSNRLFSAKLITAAIVCLTVLSIFTYSELRKDIIIEDITGSKAITTFKSNVDDALKENGIKLKPIDQINLSLDQKLTDGLKIVITRSNYINLAADGKELSIVSAARTVKDALIDSKVILGEKDKVFPALDTEITGDTYIKVTRVIEKLEKKVEAIEFTNSIVKTDKLDIGIVKAIKKGTDGKREITTKLVFEDGKQVSTSVIADKIVQQPINGIIEQGTKDILLTSRGDTRRFTKSMVMSATAYDLSFESTGKMPDHPYYGITRSGLKAREGIVAVDPRVIPLGTYLYIEGYGEALAADTGGAIKGNKIDLFYNSSQKVNAFGRKNVKVYILDKPRYKF